MTLALEASTASRAIVRALGKAAPVPDAPWAYWASVFGMRKGPTTWPWMFTSPRVTSVKYSRTLLVGITPVEKNNCSKWEGVCIIGLSEKSTSTTITRTTPRSGARSAAAPRIMLGEAPRG